MSFILALAACSILAQTLHSSQYLPGIFPQLQSSIIPPVIECVDNKAKKQMFFVKCKGNVRYIPIEGLQLSEVKSTNCGFVLDLWLLGNQVVLNHQFAVPCSL